MLELFEKGGPVMYPLLLCSVTAVVIILWRFYALHRVKVNAGEFMQSVHEHLSKNEIEDAIETCDNFTGPVVSIVKAGLKKYRRGGEEIANAIENAGSVEVAKLEQGLLILLGIAKTAPLLGFLGTVAGMIGSMATIGQVGVENPQMVARGISEALITTATGLAIAIPVYLTHFYFTGRINGFVRTMQESSIQVLDAMVELEENIAIRSSQFEKIGGEYLEF